MEWESVEGSSGSKKEKRRGGCMSKLLKVAVVLVVACAAIWFFFLRPPELTWPKTGLATMLPTPEKMRGEIRENSDDSFLVRLEGISQDDYWVYLEACKEAGYTVDAQQDLSDSYEAYSEDGYALKLTLWGNDSLSVSLEAPEEMGALVWPTSGPGALVPAPESTVGKVVRDSAVSFEALVGETDRDGFAAYCDAVAAAGFAEDYRRDDSSYSAENLAGDRVSLDYEGFDTVRVRVNLADEAQEPADEKTAGMEDADAVSETPASTDEVPAAETMPVSGDGQDAAVTLEDDGASESAASDSVVPEDAVDPAFKATMDEYEAFFNEYVDFMLRYEDGGATAQMLVDYSSMMTRYAEVMQSLDAIDSESLSVADAAYYTEVMARITARLAELSE